MRKNDAIKFFLPVIIWLIIPISVSASVEISEIMYDPKGGDAGAGGEWIEIHNTDTVAIDLTRWIFFENNTNHGITADNVAEIPASGYAVISSNLDYFKTFFTNYSGLLFKASFSLNTGESLAMKSAKDATPSDSVTYSSDWGGKDDSNSLQKISGQWKAGTPTPGVANVANSSSGNNPPTSGQSTSSSSQSSSQTTSTEKPPEILVDAGVNRTVVVGADALFLGKALGADNRPLENVRFLWNFGDGETKEGQNVLHRFRFPGEYIVTLDIAYGKWSAAARLTATAIKSPLVISRVEEGPAGLVEIVNEGSAELDLFGWYLKSGNISFLIPKNTIIVGGKKIIFPNEVTGLATDDILLLYPNGVVAADYEKTAPPAPAAPVIVPVKESPSAPKPVSPAKSDLIENQVRLEETTAPPVAAVYETKPENSGLGIWLLALGGLIVVSLGAFLFSKQKPIPADEYKIIE